jgi:hypothetical protein
VVVQVETLCRVGFGSGWGCGSGVVETSVSGDHLCKICKVNCVSSPVASAGATACLVHFRALNLACCRWRKLWMSCVGMSVGRAVGCLGVNCCGSLRCDTCVDSM